MSTMSQENNLNVLIVGDPHISGKNPLARKDNVVEIQFDKLEEAVSIANDNDAYIFFVGDLTDYPYIGYGIYSRIAEILTFLKRKAFLVYGQHDLFFHNIKTKISTATGSLEYSKLIYPISEFNKEFPEYKFDFINWGEKLNKTDNKFFISHMPIVKRSMVDNHHWLRESNKKGENKFLILEDLTNYKLAICGDWHRKYTIETKNTLLINPGAMVRREASEDEKQSTPTVVLLNLKTLKHKDIILTHNKDVFSLSHLIFKNKSKEFKNKSKDFIEKLKNRRGSFKGSNFLKKLFTFIDTKELNKEEKKLAESIIEKTFGDKYKKGIEINDNEKTTKRNRITKIKIRRS